MSTASTPPMAPMLADPVSSQLLPVIFGALDTGVPSAR